jgi:phosphoribosyl-ATP pyrophosphohydrolase
VRRWSGCGGSSNRAAGPIPRPPTRQEAVEAVIEGVKGDPAALVGESADLLYHLFVLWAALGVSPAEVAGELRRREGTSGIAEKKGRKGR